MSEQGQSLKNLNSDEFELHSLILTNMAEGICLVDPSRGLILYANPKFTEMFGYEPGELDGKPVSIVNYDDNSGLAEKRALEIMGSVQAHGTYSYEVLNVRKDGTPFWCRATASLFEHQRFGKVLVAVQEDISERRRAESELAASERKYRTLVEGACDPILVSDPAGRITLVNEQLGKKFGYSPGELLGQKVEILIPERFRHQHVLSRRSYIHEPYPRPMSASRNLLGRRKDGSEFPVEISLGPVTTSEGVRVTAVIRDVTERKRAEDQQAFLSDLGPVLSEMVDPRNILQVVAQKLCPRVADMSFLCVREGNEWIFRFGASEARNLSLLARHFAKFNASTRGLSYQAVLERRKPLCIENTGIPSLCQKLESDDEWQFLHNLGVNSCFIVPIFTRSEVTGAIGLFMTTSGRLFSYDDLSFLEIIAERVSVAMENGRLFMDAKQATKARETILSIVSHDLRNSIFVVDATARELAEDDLTLASIRERGDILKKAATQMNRLVSDLLDASKIESGSLRINPENCAVAGLVEEAVQNLSEAAREKGISLTVDSHEAPGTLFCDKGRILQVLWNLVGNAIKFTPVGGKVALSVRDSEDEVCFEIRDNGPGIPFEHQNRVFEQFWQAKETSELGVGLGLAIAQGIVEAHGGRIRLESVEGKGSTFSFSLPNGQGA